MTDEQGEENTAKAQTSNAPRMRAGRPVDPRYSQRYADMQRNLANRLFPGPSRLMSSQVSEHIEGLLTPLDDDAAQGDGRRGLKGGTQATSGTARPPREALEKAGLTASGPTSAATAEDIAHLRETLDEQSVTALEETRGPASSTTLTTGASSMATRSTS